LATLKNRRKEDVIIVDNLINSFSNDMRNGVPIKPYIDEIEDYELKYLADVLEEVAEGTDCMAFLERKFGFEKFYSLP